MVFRRHVFRRHVRGDQVEATGTRKDSPKETKIFGTKGPVNSSFSLCCMTDNG